MSVGVEEEDGDGGGGEEGTFFKDMKRRDVCSCLLAWKRTTYC